MIKLTQAVIVEGKYDKIKLSSILDALIITTDGFGIFKDKDKIKLIRSLAKKNGIIILTDSDEAGFKIRSYIKGCVPDGKITNIFIPEIKGKEKRKIKPSAAGTVGVEGIDAEILKKAFEDAGVTSDEKQNKTEFLNRQRLFDDGLIGTDNSSVKRSMLLKELALPSLLSVSAMIDVINTVFSEEEYNSTLEKIAKNKA